LARLSFVIELQIDLGIVMTRDKWQTVLSILSERFGQSLGDKTTLDLLLRIVNLIDDTAVFQWSDDVFGFLAWILSLSLSAMPQDRAHLAIDKRPSNLLLGMTRAQEALIADKEPLKRLLTGNLVLSG
jgi:hypothetical protein